MDERLTNDDKTNFSLGVMNQSLCQYRYRQAKTRKTIFLLLEINPSMGCLVLPCGVFFCLVLHITFVLHINISHTCPDSEVAVTNTEPARHWRNV